MQTKNSVYIGISLDGQIADKSGNLDWLDMIPNPNQEDMGFTSFMNSVDALLMGRTTFETVCAFDVPWPYTKPVYVLTSTLKSVPAEYSDKVILVNGDLKSVLNQIHANGHFQLYIDGGRTIQSFFKEDLIDEITITTIPILLGAGAPLFGTLTDRQEFELVRSEVFLDQIVQSHYKRKS